jgi:uncharacterized protein (TIGR03437 family)
MNGTKNLGIRISRRTRWVSLFAAAALAASTLTPLRAGTFGTVVPIGGTAADIALDEARGVLYIANFGANRIDVMSLQDKTIKTSYNVAPQPGSLALSPDGQYLVIAHFGNFVAPGSPQNALTVIRLNGLSRQTFALGFPPLGVAFGNDGLALVVTSNEFMLFDPASGYAHTFATVQNVTANTLPVPPANFPPQIIAASLGVSADGYHIYGLSDTIRFHYNVMTKTVTSLGYGANPPLGPRVVSVSKDGSYYTAGWAMFNASGVLLSQFPNPLGALNIGSHAIDSSAGLIYAQIPQGTGQTSAVPPITPATPAASTDNSATPPILQILDADNLNVRDQMQLAENLAGKSLLNAARDTVYAISDSGVTVLPVGSMNQVPRVRASSEDLVFRGNFCNRGAITQQVTIYDPGANATDFQLASNVPGITISPDSGTTPAVVTVTVDPQTFANMSGTVSAQIQITSSGAANLPKSVRVLINNRDPDQRGTFVDIPGKLVDLLADPARNRFYILRQDRNDVLVYDGSTNTQIAQLRTANTPTQMAITMDRQFLLVGHENSQLAYIYDLNSFKALYPIQFPFGHYPHSIAVSGSAVLSATRNAGSTHTIDLVDVSGRRATELPTLGIYKNDINIGTLLTSAPNGAAILAAMADGTTMLYDSSAGTFSVARKDFTALSGALAASNHGQFVVDNHLLNSSLVQTRQLESGTGVSSGFAFLDTIGLRTTMAADTAGGVIQHVSPSGDSIKPTRLVEAPLTDPPSNPNTIPFTRTLAPLSNSSAIVSLTTSGFTVLPWQYDAAVAPPQITAVVNAADFTQPVAPGGLITLFGHQLSPVNLATSEMPLPTALGESCLTVNGTPVPMLFVSAGQVNAQLPFEVSGSATLVLHTPGGISDNYNLNILSTAPSIFFTGTAGPNTNIPLVIRTTNNQLVTLSNPVHPGDHLVMYATGLGLVTPDVPVGMPGPSDPPAVAQVQPIVTIGGVSMPVVYAGLVPGDVGVYQIEVVVPIHIPEGFNIPLVISQGSGGTTLLVRVVH